SGASRRNCWRVRHPTKPGDSALRREPLSRFLTVRKAAPPDPNSKTAHAGLAPDQDYYRVQITAVGEAAAEAGVHTDVHEHPAQAQDPGHFASYCGISAH